MNPVPSDRVFGSSEVGRTSTSKLWRTGRDGSKNSPYPMESHKKKVQYGTVNDLVVYEP